MREHWWRHWSKVKPCLLAGGTNLKKRHAVEWRKKRWLPTKTDTCFQPRHACTAVSLKGACKLPCRKPDKGPVRVASWLSKLNGSPFGLNPCSIHWVGWQICVHNMYDVIAQAPFGSWTWERERERDRGKQKCMKAKWRGSSSDGEREGERERSKESACISRWYLLSWHAQVIFGFLWPGVATWYEWPWRYTCVPNFRSLDVADVAGLSTVEYFLSWFPLWMSKIFLSLWLYLTPSHTALLLSDKAKKSSWRYGTARLWNGICSHLFLHSVKLRPPAGAFRTVNCEASVRNDRLEKVRTVKCYTLRHSLPNKCNEDTAFMSFSKK